MNAARSHYETKQTRKIISKEDILKLNTYQFKTLTSYIGRGTMQWLHLIFHGLLLIKSQYW